MEAFWSCCKYSKERGTPKFKQLINPLLNPLQLKSKIFTRENFT